MNQADALRGRRRKSTPCGLRYRGRFAHLPELIGTFSCREAHPSFWRADGISIQKNSTPSSWDTRSGRPPLSRRQRQHSIISTTTFAASKAILSLKSRTDLKAKAMEWKSKRHISCSLGGG